MPASPRPSPPTRTRQPRSDGQAARARLLATALRLFADKGFTKTSTRDIAHAAGTNIAAISYYFGDKAGLYRAAFVEPLGDPRDDIPLFDQPGFSLRQTLDGYFSSFLAPLKQGEVVQQCMRLHYREMLEPTGMWAETMEGGMSASHQALVAVLCRHLGLRRADDEVHRLGFALCGLALQIYIGQDIIGALRPQLVASPRAINLAASRLADYGLAMVQAEMERRGGPAATARKASPGATSPPTPNPNQGTTSCD